VGAGIEAHGVSDGSALGMTVQHLLPEDVGQVDVQIAPPRDVQHLQPAADCKDGRLLRERTLHEGELEQVAFLVDAILGRMRLRLKVGGVEVPPTGEDEPVDMTQDVLGSLLAGGEQQRNSAARTYAVHVRRG